MARYNCSTMGEYFNLLKRDAKKAIKGLNDEQKNEVLSIIDEIAHHAFEMSAAARAYERYVEARGVGVKDGKTLREWMHYDEEEKGKYQTYKYEGGEG